MRRRDFLALTPVALTALGAAPRRVSPFLDGNYAPVREEITADGLKVIGKLPPGLDGMFVRNGPNPAFAPLGAYHWFDGDGMLHGVRLRDGKASYRNRYVRTEGFAEERAAGKALYRGLTGMPDLTKIAAGKEGFKNAANTALVWHDGKLLALWEGGAPHQIKVPSLDTVGRFTFGGKLRHACTAHPKVDPVTGELCFFGYQPVKPYVRYAVADAKGDIVHTTEIDIPRAVMMHDFAITATRAVFMDLPMTFSFGSMLGGGAPFRFEPKHGARFGVMPRRGKGGEIRWFDAEPCYVFHTFNAHDDGDAVVLLGCRMTRFPAEITPPDRMTAEESKTAAMPYRWRFDLKTGKTTEGPIDDVAADFPRVNDALLGRPARYGYAMKLTMDALHRYDFEKATAAHPFGKGRLGGEPVFVPRPGGKGEDDGWLVTFVHDANTNKSEMLVVEARDFSAAPVARVILPGRVPFGFHGAWVPGTALGMG